MGPTARRGCDGGGRMEGKFEFYPLFIRIGIRIETCLGMFMMDLFDSFAYCQHPNVSLHT